MDHRLQLTRQAERPERVDGLPFAAPDVDPAPEFPAAPSMREVEARQPSRQVLLQGTPLPAALPQPDRCPDETRILYRFAAENGHLHLLQLIAESPDFDVN